MRPLGRRLVGFWFGLCFGFAQNRSRSRRGGKVGISRFGRDFQGSVGAGGNLLLVFAGSHAPAFSTALFGGFADQLFARAAITAHHVRPVADRDGFIQVFMDRYRASRQAVAESCFIDLPPPVLDGHRVVFFHHSLPHKNRDSRNSRMSTLDTNSSFWVRSVVPRASSAAT